MTIFYKVPLRVSMCDEQIAFIGCQEQRFKLHGVTGIPFLNLLLNEA